MKTFCLLVVVGGAGAFLGSIAGAAFGHSALFAGGVLGGLLVSPVAALLAARLGWIDRADAKATAAGAAVGFLAAATIAVNTLSSPVGPLTSPLLIGLGGLACRRLRKAALQSHPRDTKL